MDQGEYYYYNSSSSSNNVNMKKSGQIPVFGNWDFSNDLPITQYFECARQAGLARYSSSSGDTDPRSATPTDLYSLNPPPPTSLNTKAKGGALVNQKIAEKKKVGRIYDVTQPPSKVRHLSLSGDTNTNRRMRSKLQSDVVSYPRPRLANNKPPTATATAKAKPVDEDLYKIPPDELLNNRKKKLGFISRCLVPACSA